MPKRKTFRRWELTAQGQSLGYGLPPAPCDLWTLYGDNANLGALFFHPDDKVWVILYHQFFWGNGKQPVHFRAKDLAMAQAAAELLLIGCERCNTRASNFTHPCGDCGLWL